jgi:hypothetical protein
LNPLKTLVNKHCQRLNLSRHHLAIKCGYINSTKGLRQIDSFINTLVDANDISPTLRSVLGISIDEFNSAVEEQETRIIEAERGKFKPYLEVVFSGEVTHPFYAGQAFSNIKLPSDGWVLGVSFGAAVLFQVIFIVLVSSKHCFFEFWLFYDQKYKINIRSTRLFYIIAVGFGLVSAYNLAR